MLRVQRTVRDMCWGPGGLLGWSSLQNVLDSGLRTPKAAARARAIGDDKIVKKEGAESSSHQKSEVGEHRHALAKSRKRGGRWGRGSLLRNTRTSKVCSHVSPLFGTGQTCGRCSTNVWGF